jgi:hypothetical protein
MAMLTPDNFEKMIAPLFVYRELSSSAVKASSLEHSRLLIPLLLGLAVSSLLESTHQQYQRTQGATSLRRDVRPAHARRISPCARRQDRPDFAMD